MTQPTASVERKQTALIEAITEAACDVIGHSNGALTRLSDEALIEIALKQAQTLAAEIAERGHLEIYAAWQCPVCDACPAESKWMPAFVHDPDDCNVMCPDCGACVDRQDVQEVEACAKCSRPAPDPCEHECALEAEPYDGLSPADGFGGGV